MPYDNVDSETGKGIVESTARPPGIDDAELQGLTLYEKKALIVNRELDSQGMGRYQWMIFLLCGFGYLIDLLWAQAFGLILASVQQEFGFSDAQSGDLGTSFSAGLTAGAAFWGIIVDIIGRYAAFVGVLALADMAQVLVVQFHRTMRQYLRHLLRSTRYVQCPSCAYCIHGTGNWWEHPHRHNHLPGNASTEQAMAPAYTLLVSAHRSRAKLSVRLCLHPSILMRT